MPLRCALAALALAAAAWPDTAAAIDRGRRLGECHVEVWRARDGLPGAWIRAITQTKDGYLWIGTQGGLVRYGGGAVVPVATPPPFDHGSDVMGLLAARDGAVWVAPSRGPPLCVRGMTVGACFSAADTRTFPELGADTRIVDVDEDAAGTIWLAAEDGVFRFADGRLALVKPAAAWGDRVVMSVHHDDGGRLFVGTSRGLLIGQSRPIAPMRLSPHVPTLPGLDVPIPALWQGESGAIWVAADDRVIRIAGGATEVFTRREGLPVGRLTSILEDRDGNVWIGSRDGLVRFQPGHGFVRFGQADGLPEDDISALFEDREGSLWVGTRAGGLAQFTDRGLDRGTGPPSLRESWISAIAEDASGVLWAASPRGLTRYHRGVESTYTRSDGLPSNDVNAVLPDDEGGVWVGTEAGLARLAGGRIQAVPTVATAVTALSRDHDGAILVGTAEGVVRLHGSSVERFSLPADLPPGDPGELRAIARDDTGVVLTSLNGRVLRVDRDRLRNDDASGVVGKVRSITRDPDGTLWLGTSEGIVRRRGGRFRVFGRTEGLARGDLYQVISDDLGYLWVGTGHGVLRIAKAALDEVDRGQRRTFEVVTFDLTIGGRQVRVARTRQPGVWKGADGHLRFASNRGVITIDPRRFPLNTVAPPVLIERALVDGKAATRDTANQFPPGSGAFEFHFAAVTLVEPRKAQHRYKLEGFDPDWVDAGTRRSAYYTNMKPGQYRFRVVGSNADGVWNETGDTLTLTLAPHFYQTHWFYGLAGLAAAALVFAFHRVRLERLRAQYVATLGERARVARELHDSLLQGMAATLMHLRGLRKRFGADARPAPPETVATEIQAIEELVASNIEETRHVVWDLRDRAGEPAALGPAIEELVTRIAGPGGLEAAMTVEGQAVAVPRHVRHEVLRIAQEAITNAVKHSGARRLEVRLRYEGTALGLSVCDDGRGFDAATVDGMATGHFGLTGIRERAALLGGFHLESRPGGGTRLDVTVNLKDLRDA